MRPVTVLIFHGPAPDGSGPLVRALAAARRSLAERQIGAFLAAGADEARIVEGPADGRSFGERLAAEVGGAGRSGGHSLAGGGAGGLVVLGSGSVPLATRGDLRRFVEVAAGPPGHALANNRYSADVVAISRAADLAALPPLPADNALPRWLEERAGVVVADLRSRWRLGVDIDTPLDLILLGESAVDSPPALETRLGSLTRSMADRRAEFLVAGRVSSATLRWLDGGVACRVRALVEERGLRAASRLAQSGEPPVAPTGFGATPQRPPTSTLAQLIDRDGPESLARIVATLGDAAILDTRVLMAHRFGSDESKWPPAEDRFASDLLLPASIADPWLRALTESAAAATIPIVLGGHTAVNGGLRLLAQRARTGAR